MGYFDIGANLTHASFQPDLLQVLMRSARSGVDSLLITGSNLATSIESRDMVYHKPFKAHAKLYYTAGIHPHHASETTLETLDQISELLEDPRALAVGETGIDYYRMHSPSQAQIDSLEAHIELALLHQKPLFLHDREGFEALYPRLEKLGDKMPKAVIHCFTGTLEALQAYLDLGCYIGITPWLCDPKRGQSLQSILPSIPLSRLLIETDCPYLMPKDLPKAEHPTEDKRRSEPCLLPHLASKVAFYRGETVARIQRASYQNALDFFGLDGALEDPLEGLSC